jgi:hypothetical protein
MPSEFHLAPRAANALHLLVLATVVAGCAPQSCRQDAGITGIHFDTSTITTVAPGNGARAPESDNWAITWGADGHQYATFGDGIGFRTRDDDRGSLGVVRIEGDQSDYSAFDVFKTNRNVGPGWTGKSYGILDIDGTLWMWRAGTGSDASALAFSRLYRSDDKGASWSKTGVQFDSDDFPDTGYGPAVPTFLQYGRGYRGARDGFVYSYFYEDKGSGWDVQRPGEIVLARVPVDRMERKDAYEFFSGGEDGTPAWSRDPSERLPVFTDASNGVMRTSVSFNRGLGKYFLITQQVSRHRDDGAHIGIYAADTPWGPWDTVLLASPWALGLQTPSAGKTVYWNFSNKWLSNDGRQFVMVYTGPEQDGWGTVEGRFELAGETPPR